MTENNEKQSTRILLDKHWKDSSCFPLIEKCNELLVVVPEQDFIDKFGEYSSQYDYYIESMFCEVTPFCGCGSGDEEKIDMYLKLLNKGDDYKLVYEGSNELVYGFIEHEGLMDHGNSMGGCRLTEKGKWLVKYLEQYRQHLKDDDEQLANREDTSN